MAEHFLGDLAVFALVDVENTRTNLTSSSGLSPSIPSKAKFAANALSTAALPMSSGPSLAVDAFAGTEARLAKLIDLKSTCFTQASRSICELSGARWSAMAPTRFIAMSSRFLKHLWTKYTACWPSKP